MAVEIKPLNTFIDVRALIEVAARNLGVVEAQVRGLTHDDSLLQLPFRGNCLNWVLGHITQERDMMLMLVAQPVVLTPEQYARYDRGSRPVTDASDAMLLDDILAALRLAHQRLTTRLAVISPDDLLAPAPELRKGIPAWTTAEFLNFLIWHETYHVGQTEILRQLAGKNDQVI